VSKQSAKSDKRETFGDLKVEQRINKAFVDPGGAGGASVSVQGPDAIDRNLALSAGEALAGRGVQSPDAQDRNLTYEAPAGVEPRDVAPVWIGDGSALPAHTYGGDDNAGPTAGGVATDEGQLTGGNQMQMSPIAGDGDLAQ
jgi:hypothetical protein